MSDEKTALFITIAVIATLVFWLPAIHFLARHTKTSTRGLRLVRWARTHGMHSHFVASLTKQRSKSTSKERTMPNQSSLLTFVLAMSATIPAVCQSTPVAGQSGEVRPAPVAASATTVIPALIRYAGGSSASEKKPQTSATFLIFKDESGGEPLWTETQMVLLDTTGKYEVYLGATNGSGLPLNLFATGEARWLEVQIAGERPQTRVLLTSVPYAIKASDAATLGGLPASAFALAGSQVAAMAPSATTTSASPDASSTVTTSGGSSDYLPKFTGGSTIANSEIYDTGTSVGIGDKPNAGAKLDVNGPMIMRGSMTVSRTGNATSSQGYPSYGFDFYSNAYNSSTKATDNPHFILQSEPTGNNTSTTGATFNLLYSNLGATPAETGLSVNSSGVIKFATGQTFDLKTSSGIVVEGNSTSGTGVEGTSSTGNGVIGSITPSETTSTAAVLGLAGAKSGFYLGESAAVWGDSYENPGVYGSSYQSDGIDATSYRGFGVQASSTIGPGVSGDSQTNSGVFGTTSGSSDSTAGVRGIAGDMTSGYSGIAGIWGESQPDVGVYGTSVSAAGVDGISTNASGVYGNTGNTTSGYSAVAGVWGDAASQVGVYGSSASVEGVYGVSASEDGVFGENDQTAYVVSGAGVSGHSIGYSYGMYGWSDKGDGSLFSGGTDDHDGDGGRGVIAAGGSGNGTGDGLSAYPGDSGAYAGVFGGSISVSGSVNSSTAQLKIDHPTDPANKYLVHSAVQSSEMMNIYTGNVMTDDLGLATVTLPSWFESLNTDFRYQLTSIGQDAHAWIAQEIKDGQFRISTNTEHVKVSWQITAVRQDAYAKAHPMVVEEAKPDRERGFYLHPELFGHPAERQTEWGRHPAAMLRLQAQREKVKTRVAAHRQVPAPAASRKPSMPVSSILSRHKDNAHAK